MHKISCQVPTVPCTLHRILQTPKDRVYIGCMGGAKKTFACKSQECLGRIGIFTFMIAAIDKMK